MQNKIGVNEWKAMFRDVGLDEANMKKWHHLFETKHPESHQSFLEWLGLSSSDVDHIRKKSA